MKHAKLATSPRLQRVHACLSDGRERTTRQIVREAHVCAVNSCIAELRANGAEIAVRHVRTKAGRRWYYRMVRPAPAEPRHA